MDEQIEAIRNEIKRLEEIHERNLKKPMERGRIGFAHGVVECCDRILSFIDSLPESNRPKLSDNLEDAAEQFARFYDNGTCDGIAQDCFIAGSEWQKKQDQETIELAEDHAMLAGRMQMKEQMMKDAVDAIVENWNPDPEPEITIPLNPEEFTPGDKVRIIIVKED